MSARPQPHEPVKASASSSGKPAAARRSNPAAVSGDDKPTPPRPPIAPPFVAPIASPIPPGGPRERDVLAKLESELRELNGKTAWAILGVSQGADAIEIKHAFFDASKRYHPHLFARYAEPAIKNVVTELFIAHKRAYVTMQKLIARPSRFGGTK